MSFNDLLKNYKKDNIHLLSDLSERRESFLRLDEKQDFENKILAQEELIEYYSRSSLKRSYKQEIDLNKEMQFKELVNKKYKRILREQEKSIEDVLSYKDKVEIKKLSFISKVKEIKQKLSYLNKTEAEFLFKFKEKFYNFYNIESKKLKAPQLNVSTEGNVCTLPVVNKENIRIGFIQVGNESNIVPGSLFGNENKLIYNIIDDNKTSFFECYKLDEGPAKLEIILELEKEEIVNEIEIESIDGSGAKTFEVKEMHLYDKEERTFNIDYLLNKNLQKFMSDSYSENNLLVIKFLPVKTQRIKLLLVAEEYFINNERKVFNINLKNIKLNKIKYAERGELFSTELKTIENTYSYKGSANVFPKQEERNIKLLGCVDNGGEFLNILDNFIYTNGREQYFQYKLILEKNLNNFSLEEKDRINFHAELDCYSKQFNRNISPGSYFLNVNKKNLIVYQPKIARRTSNEEEKVNIKTTRGQGLNKLFLPLNLNRGQVDLNELSFYVNDEKKERVLNRSEVTETSYWIRSDGKEILFDAGVNEKTIAVSYSLKEKEAVIIKEKEGYYIKIDEAFDPDKKEIKIKNFYKDEKVKIKNVAKNAKFVFLEEGYLEKSKIKFEYFENNVWNEFSEEDYTIDPIEGIIFCEKKLDLERRLNYQNYIFKEIKEEDYKIWINSNNIRGLFLEESSLVLENLEQTLNENEAVDFSITDGERVQREVEGDNKRSFVLKDKNIIKGTLMINEKLFDESFEEVEYINGFTEFKNLILVERDNLTNVEANTNGEVIISLDELPVENEEIKIFNKDLEEINYNLIDRNEKILKIQIEESSTKGFFARYFTKDKKESNASKYSVNYKQGVLYTSEDVTNPLEEIKIKYSKCLTILEYDIINRIEDFEIEEEEIKVFFERFSKLNNRIKFASYDLNSSYKIEGMEEYYSPIIYDLEIGMK